MTGPTSSIEALQLDMRRAYLCGAPGMMISALVWCIAGVVCIRFSPERAIWTLFIGGMLIHPVSTILERLLGRSGQHTKGNPLAALAMASTFWMILMLPLAYVASRWQMGLFFPAMLLVIGGRYLTFSFLYGMRIYWICGIALATAGWVLAASNAAPAWAAFTGAAIEAVFAILIHALTRRRQDG